MIHVIKKSGEDKFRTIKNARQPYTHRLDLAKTFASKEQAAAMLCPGIEVVVDVSHYLR